MIISSQLHIIFSRRLYCKAIAVAQLIVMVLLAAPACCYELEPCHEKAGTNHSAKSNDAGRDKDPCCPDENKSDFDNCSTCSCCAAYAPLTQVISAHGDPSIAQLISPEPLSILPDVNIPIFIPPQNLV